jgi:hypothetical protein
MIDMTEKKFKLNEKLQSILDTKYNLEYDDTPLDADDLEWLFEQIYRQGFRDAINDIDNSIYNIKLKRDLV